MTDKEFIDAKACFCTKCTSWYFVAGSCNCHRYIPTITTTGTGTVYLARCSKCGSMYATGSTHICFQTFPTYTYTGNSNG